MMMIFICSYFITKNRDDVVALTVEMDVGHLSVTFF